MEERIKLPQCSYLNNEGKRCRRRSALRLNLHLESELYDYPNWVQVNLCIEHYSYYGGDFRRPLKQNNNDKPPEYSGRTQES